MNACSVNFFHGGFSCRVGDGTAGIVGFDLIIRESIDQILLPQVLEEILLAPAFEHAMSHHDGTQVPTAGHHPARSKTTVECRCGPSSSRTSRSTGISILVMAALASAVTTNRGSPRSSLTQ